ncbi:MAG: hypothetical protein IK990_01620 [Ruminiclostridium sp.]|nr:hypothetical protein [Ruminiclostridium sp.]
MEKKTKVDGISLAIVILNIAIVAVLILLVTLIYLYMTGKLEPTDVANMEQSEQTAATLVTTALTTDTVETTTEPEEMTVTEETEAEPDAEETEETGETTEPEVLVAVETDDYSDEFFANDFFIGDSIYTGLVNYGYFDSSQVFAKIGLNPESVLTDIDDTGLTAVGKAEAMQPKHIFIMLGSNGIAFMGNTHMAEKMHELVDKLREACPESYIYVVSIPPVTKEHDAAGQETMVMVNGYNKLLKGMCEEAGVVYLDLCSKLQDSSGYFSADYAEADGMHFLGSAYKHMLAFFQREIQL